MHYYLRSSKCTVEVGAIRNEDMTENATAEEALKFLPTHRHNRISSAMRAFQFESKYIPALQTYQLYGDEDFNYLLYYFIGILLCIPLT
jgi:hypothetical protein